MANAPPNDHTARNLALVGGGALLVWMLLGGAGLGLGDGGTTGTTAPPAPCKVRIDVLGVHVDGKPTDVATAIHLCRASGRADVKATGDARSGTVQEVMRGLVAAGVQVNAGPDVWSVSRSAP